MTRSTSARRAALALRRYALSLPGAWEDHPWGDDVIKVGQKIFVFLGMPGDSFGLGVKLPLSNAMALAQPFATPSGYGLGKAGWVNAHFEPDEEPPVEMLREWINESYRAVAPKRLVAELAAKPSA